MLIASFSIKKARGPMPMEMKKAVIGPESVERDKHLKLPNKQSCRVSLDGGVDIDGRDEVPQSFFRT
ncbi:MAG: hypothetical protein IPO36_12040 [Anaerolineales bacterium]|nr:hypothetical protein [Anaerolineales bacterium]